jgi:hypothetical protein
MSFATAWNALRPDLPCYLALAKYGLLRLNQDTFEYHPDPAAPPLAARVAAPVFSLGSSACTESYVLSRTLAEGPKVFPFDALTCEALENFDLSVSIGDYLQPFSDRRATGWTPWAAWGSWCRTGRSGRPSGSRSPSCV